MLAVAEDHHPGVHDPVGSAARADRDDPFAHLAALDEVLQVLPVEVAHEVPVGGVREDPLQERLVVREILDGVTEDFRESGVHVLEYPVGPCQCNAHGGVVREDPEAFLALDEGVLDALAVRDVGEHDHGAALVDARSPELENLDVAVPAGNVEHPGASPDVRGHVRLPGLQRLAPVIFVGEGLEEPFLSSRDVFEGVTRDSDKLRVDVEEFPLFAEQEDAVGRFLYDGPEGLPLVLEGLFQLGDAFLQGRQFLVGLFL